MHHKKKSIGASTGHCNIRAVVEAILYQIEQGWMTRKDFNTIHEQVNENLKEGNHGKI